MSLPLNLMPMVGGKGASLARMAAAGLPVPPGFHVTTAAYRRFVTENGLQEEILAAVSAVTADHPCNDRRGIKADSKAFRQECDARMILLRPFVRHMQSLAEMTYPSRYVPLPPLKTCLRCRLLVSRRRISTCTAKRWYSMPSNAAGLRSGQQGHWLSCTPWHRAPGCESGGCGTETRAR